MNNLNVEKMQWVTLIECQKYLDKILIWKMCVLVWMEALKMPKNWSYPTKFVLRLQLIVVVAFRIVKVARFGVDRLKGAHTTAGEGVG